MLAKSSIKPRYVIDDLAGLLPAAS
jgi:hypothetical protein